jgi:hypothetical protein
MPSSDELWVQWWAAEKEVRAARDRYAAFEAADLTSDLPPEGWKALSELTEAGGRAIEAQRDLDASINPEWYAADEAGPQAGPGPDAEPELPF